MSNQNKRRVVISSQDEEHNGIFPGLTDADEGFGNSAPEHSIGGFAIGVNEVSSSGVRATKKRISWTRKNQGVGQMSTPKTVQVQGNDNVTDGYAKKKASKVNEVLPKFSKHTDGLMVHQKPSNPQ